MDAIMHPPPEVLADFGAAHEPIRLEGGRGATYRAGDLVLKPVEDEKVSAWVAGVCDSVGEDGFRVPRPVKTKSGRWSSGGWAAWAYISGNHLGGRWEDKIRASVAFHQAISHVQRPPMFDRITSPWTIADKVAWGEKEILLHPRLKPAAALLREVLRPVEVRRQAIHGDLCGNILFSAAGDPWIIDFTPFWRPADFALGLLVAEALVWEHADESIFRLVPDTAGFLQLLARAELRRLVELQTVHQKYNLIDEHLPTIHLIRRKMAEV